MVNNAFVFVGDALREDFLSDKIFNEGERTSAIASSTITPTSFSSIFSGLHPVQHSVRSFGHQLSNEKNWMLYGHKKSASFYQRLGKRGEVGIYNVLGATEDSKNKPLEELEPPFIHVERANETHAAYSRTDFEITAHEFWNEYLKDGVITDPEPLLEIYKKGVEKQAQRFKERLDLLEERELLEDTLVIFTSDHGELLGIRNALQRSHTLPLWPELIRVPIIVIHPESKNLQTDLVSHIDIVPTIAEELYQKPPANSIGINIFEEKRESAYSDFEKPTNVTPLGAKKENGSDYSLVYRSIWDQDGGYVISRSKIMDRIRGYYDFGLYSKKSLISPNNIQNMPEILRSSSPFLHKNRKYGNPSFSSNEANNKIKEVEELSADYNESVINQSKEEQLRALGYK